MYTKTYAPIWPVPHQTRERATSRHPTQWSPGDLLNALPALSRVMSAKGSITTREIASFAFKERDDKDPVPGKAPPLCILQKTLRWLG